MRPLTAACWAAVEGDVDAAAPAELSSRLTLSIESAAETRLLEAIPPLVEAFLRNDCSSTTFKIMDKMFCYCIDCNRFYWRQRN